MVKEKTKVAVLLPTFDELGSTIDRSIENVALRMREVQGVAWALLIGVNGTSKLEEVARISELVNGHSSILKSVQVQVHHYLLKGKENAMNQLAHQARSIFGGKSADMHIGTDLKVYRTPGSLMALIHEFETPSRRGENPRYLGGNILPYPITVYEKYFSLTDEQRLFYTLLEIDKHSTVMAFKPKTHLRGGLYITGKWTELATDAPDDFTISRKARLDFGPEAVKISQKAVGYVIPRQSFADYFAVRLKRSLPAEESLRRTHPEYDGLREVSRSESEEVEIDQKFKQQYPDLYALYYTKKSLDKLTRELAINLPSARHRLDEMSAQLKSHSIELKRPSLECVSKYARIDPMLAAMAITVYYRSIIEALAINRDSIQYGPREERYRGMLPLD